MCQAEFTVISKSSSLWTTGQHLQLTDKNIILLEKLMFTSGVSCSHYSDVIMGTIASQITSLTIVYSTVYSDEGQRKHQSSAPLAFVRGIHRGPVNSPCKWPVTRKMFPFDDVIVLCDWADLTYDNVVGWNYLAHHHRKHRGSYMSYSNFHMGIEARKMEQLKKVTTITTETLYIYLVVRHKGIYFFTDRGSFYITFVMVRLL